MRGSSRLGELLVEGGFVTQAQLDEAVQRQLDSGRRLGTNLVELGYVDEATVGRVLSQQLSLASVTAAQLEAIDPELVALVPAGMAERLRVIPVRRDAGRLWVAMVDPTDQLAMKEVATLTGLAVRAMIAPELLVQYALERHYQTRRRPTVIELAPELDVPIVGVRTQVDGYAGLAQLEEAMARAPEAPATPAAPAPGASDDDAVKAELLAAPDEAAILTVALKTLAAEVPRLALFAAKKGVLAGWRGVGVDEPTLQRFRIALRDLPFVVDALSGGRIYAGPLPPEALGALQAVLGSVPDATGLLFPVHLGRTLVACIVGVGALGPPKLAYDRLAQRLNHALMANHYRKLLRQS